MVNLAILVGNTNYSNLNQLQCCHEDLEAMKQLLDATGKYDEVSIIENAHSDSLKDQLRETLDKTKNTNELFFYFTGHGYQLETEFFHCATNFDQRRPNETGLSITELHEFLRQADAGVVVKVIDACNSGTLLVKSERAWQAPSKGYFKKFIQFASCLEAQNSLTGDPLSAFTEKFRSAALRKTSGPVFYTDIIATLRDDFLENGTQTPFFVFQDTARESLIDDAAKFTALRNAIEKAKAPLIEVQETSTPSVELAPLTLSERLKIIDEKVVKPEKMSSFVEGFFTDLIRKLKTNEFGQYYDVGTIEHNRFEEPTTEKFIVRVMSKEKRLDNFVTATHTRKLPKNLGLLSAFQNAIPNLYGNHDLPDEEWELRLNCSMAKAQLCITLTPKFTALQRIILVVTCAPSLEHCFIFEIGTQHRLQDFGKFDSDGIETTRRWWKVNWNDKTSGIASQISAKFEETVKKQLEDAENRVFSISP